MCLTVFVVIDVMKDAGISPDKHALIIPPFMSRGRRVHPMSIPDSPMSCKFVEFDRFLMFVNTDLNLWASMLVSSCLLFVIDADVTVHSRPMDPKKDLAVYGYGTVAWKERMEEWKKKQNEKLQVVKHPGGGNNDGDGGDDPDLPM